MEILTPKDARAWNNPAEYWQTQNDATASYVAPVVALNLEAFSFNAHDLKRRAGGLPIRVASKSIRVRSVLEAILQEPGFEGILAFTLAEALWLAETFDDIVVAYPSTDKAALKKLTNNQELADRVTIMVDSPAQLELIESITPNPATVRVCLDFDASWWAPVIGNVGVLRSPMHEPRDLRALAEDVLRRKNFKLVGVMSYEAQIAGVGNEPIGRPLLGKFLSGLQKRSSQELRDRRAEAIASVREIVDLEFVNGGGTGSLESTASEPALTEVAAGSGFFGPHLFDNYAHFKPAPAVGFALDVVRKARPESATVLGGGWVASGVAGADRLPRAVWPEGLRFTPREGAGEVQTPLLGKSAADLRVGDRVWFRHTKSGEVMEHTNKVLVVREGKVIDSLKTYRGEEKAFL